MKKNKLDLSPFFVVVGSINLDLVAQVDTLPRSGETILANAYEELPGGKGANQAVAAARLGAECHLIGRVGDDGFGQKLLQSLSSCGVKTDALSVTPNSPSGMAMINVDRQGENAITVIAGANGRLTPEDIEKYESLIDSAAMVLLQLEIPYLTIIATIRLAARHHIPIMLDPAPAPIGEIPDEFWQVDYLTPNETEARSLTGLDISDLRQAERAARVLRDRGPRNVVLKLGQQGVMLCDENQRCTMLESFPVTAKDTTAAGDAFNAALAFAICRNADVDLPRAVRFGCAAGAFAASQLGAQPSMPTLQQVEAILAGN